MLFIRLTSRLYVIGACNSFIITECLLRSATLITRYGHKFVLALWWSHPTERSYRSGVYGTAPYWTVHNYKLVPFEISKWTRNEPSHICAPLVVLTHWSRYGGYRGEGINPPLYVLSTKWRQRRRKSASFSAVSGLAFRFQNKIKAMLPFLSNDWTFISDTLCSINVKWKHFIDVRSTLSITKNAHFISLVTINVWCVNDFT